MSSTMKKLILSLALVAFAVAVQADGDTCPAKDKACCPKQAECPKSAEQTKAGCCPAAKQTAKNTKQLKSPKAASLAKK